MGCSNCQTLFGTKISPVKTYFSAFMEVVLFAFLRENWYTNFEKHFSMFYFSLRQCTGYIEAWNVYIPIGTKTMAAQKVRFSAWFLFCFFKNQKEIGSMEHFVWFSIRIKRFKAKVNLKNYSVTKIATTQTRFNANLDVIIFAFFRDNGCD